EQALEHMLDRMLQAIPREPERNQRVVMWPDRAVVIGHRIIPGLAERDRANTPAGEEVRPQEINGDATGTILADHAAEQQMSRIRRAHRARPLLAVERQRIGAELLAPECFLEALGQLARLHLEPLRDLAPPEPLRA